MTTDDQSSAQVVRGRGVLLTRDRRQTLGDVAYELSFFTETGQTRGGREVRGPTYAYGTIFNCCGLSLAPGDPVYLQAPDRSEEIELIIADGGDHSARPVITGSAFRPMLWHRHD